MGLLINAQPDLCVCGESEISSACLNSLQPAVLLIALSQPGGRGIDLLQSIRKENPDLPIVIMSGEDDSQHALQALQSGAAGYILMAEPVTQIVAGLRSVLKGELHLSSHFRERLIFQIIHSSAGSLSPLKSLTPREQTVLDALGRGCNTRSAALQLGISVKTVETHRGNIKEKLRFQSSQQMVSFAMDLQRARPSSRDECPVESPMVKPT